MIRLVETYVLAPAAVVGGGPDRSGEKLWQDACTLASRLPDPRDGSHVLIVCTHDTAAFVVALLATWIAGHAAALPPDHRRPTMAALLERDEVVALLHDTGAGKPIRIAATVAQGNDKIPPDEAVVESDALAVTHFLSTHDKDAVERLTHGELLAKADAADAPDKAVASGPIATTVLPACPRGLIEGVLNPLRRRSSLWWRMGADPHTLASMDGVDFDKLVTTDVHWRKLTRIAGDDPTHRVHHVDCLDVDQPRDEPEQRMVALLSSRVDVDEFGLAAVSEDHRLAAVVLRPGFDSERFELEVEAKLVTDLAPTRVQLRIVTHLDRDAAGRLDRAALLRQFGRRADGHPLTTELVWGDASQATVDGTTEHRFAVDVPADYAWYQGHFPGYPVMAGVVQLQCVVLPCVRRAWPQAPSPSSWSRLKFTKRIAPGDALTVVLRRGDGDTAIDFELRRDDTVVAAGRMLLPASAASLALARSP